MGYRLAAGLFTAPEVGAPHRRERLFILAIRKSDELADPARLLRHPVERRQSQREPAPLADAPGQRQRKPADQTDAVAGGGQARDEPRDHGHAMADAAGGGRQQTERRQPQIGRSDPCEPDVDDADGAGSQGWGNDAGEHPCQRPAWPPSPHDANGWKRYLRSAPDAEPAIRRGADGLANRVDRLRLCGNGVVPWLQRMRSEPWRISCRRRDDAAPDQAELSL
ncbi:DNA cytosine methyltransferase [Paracoccus sp. YLB-12]|uniref:DNA cytosine methyltransferase n=1 Tax=Paracoccus maritimus TaxID=2933292 RepID=A0ABT2KCS8_9RHOB|nr:DNA cytosine methyltransferase [Paracoccus sp. YLB-12]MCT4334336.1 DNA cytosine methyltransferase [Paracoccus sp. YLB-12]